MKFSIARETSEMERKIVQTVSGVTPLDALNTFDTMLRTNGKFINHIFMDAQNFWNFSVATSDKRWAKRVIEHYTLFESKE